jgi:glycosyl transferase family 25
MEYCRKRFIDFVDKAIYVNLQDRSDRNQTMKEKISMFGQKAERFNAIKHEIGGVGCTLSHIAILKLAIDSDWNNILILEDDIEWNETELGYKNLNTLISNPFDVIMLGSGYSNFDTKSFRITKGNSSHGYLVNRHYFKTLLQNLTTSYNCLTTALALSQPKHPYGMDIFWIDLQKRDNWFIVLPNLLHQESGYSDIDKKYCNFPPNLFVLNPRLYVIEAFWGVEGNKINVTDRINQICPNKDFILRQSLFDIDPSFGNMKYLYLSYSNGSHEIFRENCNICIYNYDLV